MVRVLLAVSYSHPGSRRAAVIPSASAGCTANLFESKIERRGVLTIPERCEMRISLNNQVSPPPTDLAPTGLPLCVIPKEPQRLSFNKRTSLSWPIYSHLTLDLNYLYIIIIKHFMCLRIPGWPNGHEEGIWI